ncbi:UNVERIFIED_CONTAM: hypothetical protein Sindi_2896100 [Sesamum indicum]
MSSRSRSLSVHVFVSESASSLDTSSTSGSSTTSPRETAGTSRDPTSSIPQHSDLPEEVAESDETPVFQKYTEMMQQKPWLGIASNIKTTPVALKRKYYIPSDYDIIIPRSFDRMHQPPVGYCALSVLHLDAGLHFPLPREVNNILIRLGVFPMQLSPNSISHILMFIIVMKHLDLPRSFDNFWSLYYITASKRSGETGWFYLTARKDCRFLDDLRSNVVQTTPETFGEGFKSDLINYITLFWYLPKVLLQEKVLKLAGLSPAPILVKSTLASKQPSTPLEARDQIPDEQVEVVEISEDRGLKRRRGKRTAIPKAVTTGEQTIELTESRSDPSSRSTKQGRPEAKLAADWVAEPEKTSDLLLLEKAKMSGEKWVLDWNISKNSSVRRTFAGQDSWEVYKAACLKRDQAMAFAHHISLQGSMWRHDKILLEAKTMEMEQKILEQQTLIESLRSKILEKKELASRLEIS